MFYNSEYKYRLEKYHIGGSNRFTCPNCHQRRCFTRYINVETGEYLDDNCGKCDHEQSCGYHKTPHDYFVEHPEVKEQFFPAANKNASGATLARPAASYVAKKLPAAPPPVELTFTTNEVIARHKRDDTFMPWLESVVQNAELVQQVFDMYQLGTTRPGIYKSQPVIFWYINVNGIVHDGKFMWYKANGHREQWVNWASSLMIKSKLWPENATTRKCFFGEQLLTARPEATVYIVESEKSAIYCACRYPQFIWLATGGCGNLTADKFAPLKGRRVVIIPDSGKYKEWSEKMQSVKDVQYSILKDFECCPPNTDIVDLLLGEVTFTPPPAPVVVTSDTQLSHEAPKTEAEIKFEEMCQDNPLLRILQENFDLQVY